MKDETNFKLIWQYDSWEIKVLKWIIIFSFTGTVSAAHSSMLWTVSKSISSLASEASSLPLKSFKKKVETKFDSSNLLFKITVVCYSIWMIGKLSDRNLFFIITFSNFKFNIILLFLIETVNNKQLIM